MERRGIHRLKPPANVNRYFPDPRDPVPAPGIPKSSMLPPPAPNMASGKGIGQSGIPAPSGLKLPTTLPTPVIRRPAASVTASVITRTLQQEQPTSAAERGQHHTLVRRDSYTISTGEASESHPVVGSGFSSPDDHPASANILNSTLILKQSTVSSHRLTELREAEFRQHLNRAVCIGGEKRGVLRYFGPLHMVDGLFCGIELDEPVGQHDGKIDGRRYFRAVHNRGIFAPMEKVELIGHEPSRTSHATSAPATTANVELIIPADAEFLTDVEPHLMCNSILGQSSAAGNNDSFELSESLMFLKGSRFPGMDISMTPDQLAAQLRGEHEEVDDDQEEEEDDDDVEGMIQAEDFETAYLKSHQRFSEAEQDMDDATTPISEQPQELFGMDIGSDFKRPMITSTPMVKDGNLNATMILGSATPAVRKDETGRQSAATHQVKERPISTISADTGYQGDTEYETQSGRSISPREMDTAFERQQQARRNPVATTISLPVSTTSVNPILEKQQIPQQQPHQITFTGDQEEIMNSSFESLICETTIRDSRGRMVKVVKEKKRLPKSRLHDLNSSDEFHSLLHLNDVAVCGSPTTTAAPPAATAPSSPSKPKRTKSESIGRESQRKPAKSAKVSSEGGNKENRGEDINDRPSSGGAGGSPGRRKTEKTVQPEEPVKKVVKLPPKPSKHQEIMAKLQASMAQDKQKPKREIKSKFMAGIAMTPAVRSAECQSNLLLPSSRLSLLPMLRSRASSTASSVALSGNTNGQSPISSADTSEGGYQNVHSNKTTSPSDDKRTPAIEHAPSDPFKAQLSPPGKGNGLKKGTGAIAGSTKDVVAIGVKKPPSTSIAKKTGIGQIKDPPSRTSTTTTARGSSNLPTTSNGSVATAPRQQTSQRKSPPPTGKEAAGRLQELEAQAEQLKLAKERLCNSAKGFEALSVLIRYYVERVIPGFQTDRNTMQGEINSLKHRTDELTKSNDTLQVEKRQLSEAQAKVLDELCREYEQKVKKLESDLRVDYDKKANELALRHGNDMAKGRDEYEQDKNRMVKEFERQRKIEMENFEAKTVSLQEQHGRDMNDLKSLHQNVTDDLMRRFEDEKAAMTLKMDELQKLCDRYKQEARHLEDTLSKDTEKKMAAVSERFDNYKREIDSLRSVMEMKNQEMHDLRSKCSLLEKELEELPKCRTKIALLEQKNAELKEALDLKKQAEKLFYQQHADLIQSCDRERERNQRLSMDKEQLEFKLQKLIMSQSAYETPMHRMSSDEDAEGAASHRSRTQPRPTSSHAAIRDKPMSQSLIQIYAESSPWSPRSTSRTGPHHDNKDVPVTVYMSAQDGDVARILQFDTEGDSSPPGKKEAAPRTSPQTPPRAAKSVDKMASPKRRISPLRRRNVSVSSGVAPMPATPEHPTDFNGERMSSEPPPDCPKLLDYDVHDPQDPAPPVGENEHLNVGKTGCMVTASGWTDSGVFTTSCSSDTQEIMTFGTTMVDHDSTTVLSASSGESREKQPIADSSPNGAASTALNGCSKIPKKNGGL